MKTKSKIKAGSITHNPNQTRSGIKAGSITHNHNQTLR
jgi:hypothetical protein